MRIVTTFCLLAAIAVTIGCGAAPSIPTDLSIPVNDTMRAACPFADDAFIETIIIAADVDRMAGLGEAEAIQTAEDGCADAAAGNQEIVTQCSDCFSAVISEVYAQ